MAYKIKYTNRANNTLIDILEYIEERWGEEKAADVLLRVYKVVDLLANFGALNLSGEWMQLKRFLWELRQ